MPDSAQFKWFVPSEHGDQAPDALLANRTMNRIDVVLMAVVVICTFWNVLGVRDIRPGSGELATLGAADDFFLRPGSIVLWSVTGIAAAWLITRVVVTRETRFVLVWEGNILAVAALMPLLSMELAGLNLLAPDGELRLTAYTCADSTPPSGTIPHLADCGGYALEPGSITLAGKHPGSARSENRTPDAIAANTATWQGIPKGRYVLYLLVDIPDAACTVDEPAVIVIDADPTIDCLESGETVIRLEHPGDTYNLRLAIYPDGQD